MNPATPDILFQKFSAPLGAYAASSPERKEAAQMLARSLWLAMIAGPEMESETWTTLKTIGKMDDDSIQVIQELYFDQMKPAVTEEQVEELRQRYRIRRKEQQ